MLGSVELSDVDKKIVFNQDERRSLRKSSVAMNRLKILKKTSLKG